MKHNVKITLLLIFIFFLSQIFGLFIVREYVHTEKSINATTGKEQVNVEYNQIEVVNQKIETPKVNESMSFIYIMIVIVVATLFVLLLAKFRSVLFWKAWFSLSVFLSVYIAIFPFIKKIALPYLASVIITVALVGVLIFFKIYKRNTIVHNVTEVIMYGGIAAIFVPIINLFSAFMLLISISVYDFIAVWKSKHMVTMANFQTNSNVFAGLFLVYDNKTQKIEKQFPKKKEDPEKHIAIETESVKMKIPLPDKNEHMKQAILGGGDIAFPLIFAATVMKATASLPFALIIVLFSTIALSMLLFLSKPNRFYPAMPFISLGCFVGYALVFLIQIMV